MRVRGCWRCLGRSDYAVAMNAAAPEPATLLITWFRGGELIVGNVFGMGITILVHGMEWRRNNRLRGRA